MRLVHLSTLGRFAIAALGAALPIAGAALASCGTDAVGVDACRQIESARCEEAPACDPKDTKTPFDVEHCKRFYQDECLVGIENVDAGAPTDSQVSACIAAVKATGDCAAKGIATMDMCPGAPLANPTASGANTPCTVIQTAPELLRDCAFVALPPAAAVPDSGTTDAEDLDAEAGGG